MSKNQNNYTKSPNKILGLLAVCACVFVAVKNLPAALIKEHNTIHIEIDGTDYGKLNKISGLDSFDDAGQPLLNDNSYSTIVVNRDFVTDPSLYLWAKQSRSKKSTLQDIYLVTRNAAGNMVRRQVLRACQPLSWSVEATNPSLGGFNETIEFAVQQISSN